MRRLAIRAALIVVFAVLVLSAPPTPPSMWRQACVVWKPLSEPLGFLLNCDSFLFLDLAADPSSLFQPSGRIWQSRPFYVLLGAGLTVPIEASFPGLAWPELLNRRAPSWWAYVVLNFGILLLAVGLFDRLFGARRRLTSAAFVFGSWLIANDLVRIFLWTPHTQLFNVLAPVVALAVAQYAYVEPRITVARVAMLGVVLGIGALAYGSFVVPCVAFVAASWLRRWRDGGGTLPGALLARALVMVTAFAIPLAAWLTYVRVRTGGFYSHEIEDYRQFVWLYDAWREGWATLASAVGENVAFFLPILLRVLWLPCAALGALLLLAWRAGTPLGRVFREREDVLLPAAAVFGLTLGFLAFLGFYAERLTWSLVPPILAACVVVGDALDASLEPVRRRSLRAGMVLLLAIGILIVRQTSVRPLAAGSPAEARLWAARDSPGDRGPRVLGDIKAER